MIDINLIRTQPELVRENIRKKFQEKKLPLVDEALSLDARRRALTQEGDSLRANRNALSKQIGMLMREKKTEEAEKVKAQVNADAARLAEIEKEEGEVSEQIKKVMMAIPNIISPETPIGKDDSENVEGQRFLEPKVPDFEVPYHLDILEKLEGIDIDSARRTSGQGFYYLTGDVARLHSAVLAYARDFMIGKGFTYCIPPFMIRSDVVSGVMSFEEMDGMMYKIEGEDLYLIGTSEHSMIGRFMGQTIDEAKLPLTLTSYSPCFRKEKGAHGIEERGIYRIHQFEKQEMIVICKPEESAEIKCGTTPWSSSSRWASPCARSNAARATLPTSNTAAWTSKRGAPARRSTSKWVPAPTSPTRRRAASTSAIRAARARRLRIPSTTPSSRPRACSSPLSRTTCARTAASRSPKSFGPTWAAQKRSRPRSKLFG